MFSSFLVTKKKNIIRGPLFSVYSTSRLGQLCKIIIHCRIYKSCITLIICLAKLANLIYSWHMVDNLVLHINFKNKNGFKCLFICNVKKDIKTKCCKCSHIFLNVDLTTYLILHPIYQLWFSLQISCMRIKWCHLWKQMRAPSCQM